MNVLYLYNSTQTYTSTVFEHVFGFYKFSKHKSFFAHQDQFTKLNIEFSYFDVLVIHYTIRLPYNQIEEANGEAIRKFSGLKVLFIQDEYDYTKNTWHWIQKLGIDLVFTVVPSENISKVYPPAEFPQTRFVSVLTGYPPENIVFEDATPPSQRTKVQVAYRGRALPVQYGALGKEKIGIGAMVREYCEKNKINCDIEWQEESRIYGDQWYNFISSCRSTLGSESGSNVFDWDGTLARKIQTYKVEHPKATEDEIYQNVVEPLENPCLMNQISPRVFEAIALRTPLILFEGKYSGVISPMDHFIPLKKDGSNLDEVFRILNDGPFIDQMTERTYRDVIASKKYSQESFVSLVDSEMEKSFKENHFVRSPILFSTDPHERPSFLTTTPIRAQIWKPPSRLRRLANVILPYVPRKVKDQLKASLKPFLASLS